MGRPHGGALPCSPAMGIATDAGTRHLTNSGPVGGPEECAGEDLNLHELALTRPSTLRVYQFRHQRAARLYPERCYASSRYRITVLRKKSTAITVVRRVRLRSTMWVPPCDCGVNPMPPKPASRPECMRTSVIRAAETITWVTAKNGIIARGMVPAVL